MYGSNSCCCVIRRVVENAQATPGRIYDSYLADRQDKWMLKAFTIGAEKKYQIRYPTSHPAQNLHTLREFILSKKYSVTMESNSATLKRNSAHLAIFVSFTARTGIDSDVSHCSNFRCSYFLIFTVTNAVVGCSRTRTWSDNEVDLSPNHSGMHLEFTMCSLKGVDKDMHLETLHALQVAQ